MIRLVVNLRVDAVHCALLEDYYAETYGPALARQAGFMSAALGRLYPDNVLDEIGAEHPPFNYQLTIEFENEPLRREWVKSAEHDPAWEPIVGMAVEVVHTGYDLVATTRRRS